ncbi:peroxiredoxin family protein, partial [bacterium]|nr:peroxiredoxin family protein [bacterium]
ALYLKEANAKQRAAKYALTESESLWMQAINARYDTTIKAEDRAKRFIKLLEQVLKVEKDPGFLAETRSYLALTRWGVEVAGADKSDERTQAIEEVDALIENVLSGNRNHPIHHYKIHLWNMDGYNINALESAKVCGPTNPACAHMWHMQSHIYDGIWEMRNAAYQFEAAHRIDNAYLMANKLNGKVIHNYPHNMDYYLKVLNATGGVDRALELIKNILSGPRALESSSAYTDPVDWVAGSAIKLLEEYELWKEAQRMVRDGYFEGLRLDRTEESDLPDRLYRFLGLVALENGDYTKALSYADKLVDLREQISKTSAKKEVLDNIQDVEKDLRYWIRARETDAPVPLSFYEQLINLGITPKHRIALLAMEKENKEVAQKIVDNHSIETAMSLAVRAYLIANGGTGDFDTVMRQLQAVIHVPRAVDEMGDVGNLEKAFPFMSKVRSAHLDNGADRAKAAKLFAFPRDNHQFTHTEWMRYNKRKSWKDFGPYYMRRADAPVGEKYAALWPEKEWAQIPATGKMRLVILRKDETCLMCDTEENNLLRKWKTKFEKEGVEVALLTPKSIELYKEFGAYDEFKDEPAHGVFLIDSDGKIRWNARPEHAWSKWRELLQEARRLKQVKPYEPAEP